MSESLTREAIQEFEEQECEQNNLYRAAYFKWSRMEDEKKILWIAQDKERFKIVEECERAYVDYLETVRRGNDLQDAFRKRYGLAGWNLISIADWRWKNGGKERHDRSRETK